MRETSTTPSCVAVEAAARALLRTIESLLAGTDHLTEPALEEMRRVLRSVRRRRCVHLELTVLEAEQLYLGANVRAEELRDEAVLMGLGSSRTEVAAFWRALEKLQQARAEAGARTGRIHRASGGAM